MRTVTSPDERLAESFTQFACGIEPRLRYALTAAVGRERGREATADALNYAWEHWERVGAMENPAGYLYRVGRSHARIRGRRPRFERQDTGRIPDVEPALLGALGRLSERQRTVVFLIHGMEWTRPEVAELLGTSVTSVGSHLERGLGKLRAEFGVDSDG